ncbi:hypothetical protein RIF23_17555 [Lipingzhangella sp. LS1_29]|uniref:Uncharacterized protein n=1 Tax=Lipingzhangella rawalii TaxID=2055835 RepID=A0ABU2H9U4_9ACTN|nr:hypothetical protein [Lipingzhangella rawalii]MDS1272099.1 hypothetical protein [Lipingzhangella rawalii]
MEYSDRSQRPADAAGASRPARRPSRLRRLFGRGEPDSPAEHPVQQPSSPQQPPAAPGTGPHPSGWASTAQHPVPYPQHPQYPGGYSGAGTTQSGYPQQPAPAPGYPTQPAPPGQPAYAAYPAYPGYPGAGTYPPAGYAPAPGGPAAQPGAPPVAAAPQQSPPYPPQAYPAPQAPAQQPSGPGPTERGEEHGAAVAGGDTSPTTDHLLPKALANLALRDLTLVESLLTLIQRVESEEHDPKLLDILYQVDHLGARMRRNCENLLVMAQQPVDPAHSEPVALLDVVRAALSEISQYTRVRLQ